MEEYDGKQKEKKKRILSLEYHDGDMCSMYLLIAVLVVATVFFKIKKDAWNPDKQTQRQLTPEIVIETEAIYGWVETEQGTKFREEDGTFAKNAWKVWEDGLILLK